jgi:hypothetical protein
MDKRELTPDSICEYIARFVPKGSTVLIIEKADADVYAVDWLDPAIKAKATVITVR